MAFFKIINNDYILSIGETDRTPDLPITESEYNEILAVIRDKPPATETTDYRLKTDLTWEEYEIEPPDPDPEEELTAEEIAEAIEEALA